MNDLISRKALIAEYDRLHIGPPGGARKLMEEAPAVQQWIPVTERLPQVGEKVLCCGPTGGLFIARTRACAGRVLIIDDKSSVQRKATNWMPLPEPPKGE